jgi:hypothetical protein
MSRLDPRSIDWNSVDPDELEDMQETALWDDAGAPPLHEWSKVREVGWVKRDELVQPAALPEAPKLPQLPNVMLACTREDAAALLRMSVDTIDTHVIPRLRTLQTGRLVRIPIAELERYVEQNAARALRG